MREISQMPSILGKVKDLNAAATVAKHMAQDEGFNRDNEYEDVKKYLYIYIYIYIYI